MVKLLKSALNMAYKAEKIVFAPAERNKKPILEVLQKHIDPNAVGDILEISSGTGQHVVYFAEHFPKMTFQPSDFDKTLLPSIKAYSEDVPTKNVKAPLNIDASKSWNLPRNTFDYIINVNLIHVSPYSCTLGLFENAGLVLKPNGIMFTYGAYANNGVIEPESNVQFDKSIRMRNPEWGLRDIADLKEIAAKHGIKLIKKYDMPANNKCLLWQKISNNL